MSEDDNEFSLSEIYRKRSTEDAADSNDAVPAGATPVGGEATETGTPPPSGINPDTPARADARSTPEESATAVATMSRSDTPVGNEATKFMPPDDVSPIKSIAPPTKPKSDDDEEEVGIPIPFDPFRLLLALIRVLPIGFILGAVFGIGGYMVADSQFKASYSSWSQIMKVEIRDMFRTLAVGESFKPKQLSLQTMVNVMVSRAILEKVGSQMNPPITPAGLRGGLTITPERETDLITIQYASSTSPQDTVDTLNLYLREVVKMTKDLQTEEANEVNQYLTKQIGDIDAEAKVIGDKILSFSRDEKIVDIEKEIGAYLGELTSLNLQFETLRVEQETLDLKIKSLEKELAKQNPVADQLAQAKKELDRLLTEYTEENPIVINHREKMKNIENELAALAEKKENSDDLQPADTPVGQSLYLDIVKFRSDKLTLKVQLEKLASYRDQLQNKLAKLPEKGVEYAKLKAREGSLEKTRDLLMARKRETELFLENAPGLYRISTAASMDEIQTYSVGKKKMIVAGAGFAFGLAMVCFFGVVIETLDERIKSGMDLTRVTKLPVQARLGLLNKMSKGEQTSWAFRTWTQLSGLLSKQADYPTVIGLLSSEPGEGRSTWIELLSGIATNRGNKTILATNRASEHDGQPTSNMPLAEAINRPQAVIDRLSGTDARIHLLISEGWHWSLENRKAWHAALKTWNNIPGCLVFLELPPAADPESVLLAEQVTDLFWLATPTKQTTTTTADHMQILRDSTVNMVGSLLNKDVGLFRLFFGSRRKLRKILGLIAVSISTLHCAGADPDAQPRASASPTNAVNLNYTKRLPNPPPEQSQFSYQGKPKLAKWQQHLTLGPEDKINIEMYKVPASERKEVEIGPDGTISYFHATSIQAAGLTIDELRDNLTKRMREQYKNVRVIITPHQFRSKRFYMLGKITEKGSYMLDRPLTILEATAQAFGLEIGLFNHNTVELADLHRSFLMRNGKKVDVDFYKLFMQGDLSQNILIEPDDYIYIASSTANEFFVLGAVGSPGRVGYVPDSTVITSIIRRGGFADKAYLKRILVVRGSMTNPETFVVDAEKILSGKSLDFQVQPRDIIFVSEKPWQRVSELLDTATTAFIQAAVATWTGGNIGPFITRPVLPSIK